MYYENKTMKDLRIAYIGGGSRGWAWTFMVDLVLEPALSGTLVLYDIDQQAAMQNQRIGERMNEHPNCVGNWNYQTADTLEDALSGADFVLISILPGTFDEMYSDVHLPERLGIYQSVGDTAGPGGIMRALRTIPMFIEIATAIKQYAPDAWVINYTNPMSLCIKTLYHIMPEMKAFGCCHEVFGTQNLLKVMAEEVLGVEGITREEIHMNVLGINHFTWFDEASYEGVDLFPYYRSWVEQHRADGFQNPEEHWANASFSHANLVKFDLFQQYGLIAAAGDRHLAEFMPGDRYLKNPQVVAQWKFGLTSVDWRKQHLQERLEKGVRLATGTQAIELTASGEEGILLIKALCGLESIVSNVNIPNTARQITNLPLDAIVETNALFRKNSLRPVYAGALPPSLQALILPQIENHTRVLEVAQTQDFELLLTALETDPLIAGRCSREDLEKLATDMIRHTIAYLPDGWNSI